MELTRQHATHAWPRTAARFALAGAMTGIGLLHLTNPAPFIGIVPPYLPQPAALVAISGVCEILGGAGLLVPAVRPLAGWGLIALYIAVFPANVHMALSNMPIAGHHYPLLLWLRLPLQALFIAWAWWTSRRAA